MTRKAILLRNEEGILPDIKPTIRTGISREVIDRVRNFYCDDECINSRILPGPKDKVRISKNCYRQKRLILSTLKELLSSYKDQYPTDKIGFSKFCLLRPKECVLPGASGTHNICVCTEHQNFKLLLHATRTSLNYKEIISKIVCDTENRECMFRTCEKCPKRDDVEEILDELLFPDMGASDKENLENQDLNQGEEGEQDGTELSSNNLLSENEAHGVSVDRDADDSSDTSTDNERDTEDESDVKDEDDDEDSDSEDLDGDICEEDEFRYKEWTSTERAELLTKTCSKSELLELLTDKAISFLTHMFIAKQQAEYLKTSKNNLTLKEILILMDFSENYKYVVQNDVQQRY